MTRDPGPWQDSDDSEIPTRDLYVVLELVPGDGCQCPLTDLGGDVVSVRQQAGEHTCQADATVEAGATHGEREASPTVVHTSNEVRATCFCSVFRANDCVPRFTAVTADRVRIESYLPDREVLSDLVDDLRSDVDELHLRRLQRATDAEGQAAPERVTLELADLTEKQREAAIHAVSMGYYATPRAVTLGELAAEMDISKSAMSQRLNAVESKLATAAFATPAPQR